MRKSTGGLHLLSLIFILAPGCAHVPSDADRVPAEKPRVKLGFKAEFNPKGDQGAFTVDVRARFPANPAVSFSDIIELYRGVSVSNAVSAALTVHKDPPLDKIIYEVKASETRGGVTYDLIGFPKGFRVLGNRSRLVCPETLVREAGKGYWRQTCSTDFSVKGSDEYIRAYSHVIECSERGLVTECTFHVDAAMKKIQVPFLARLLFKARNYSATQAGYKAAENMVHAFYSQAKVADFPKPFRDFAVQAVDAYRSSPDFKEVRRIDAAYPVVYESSSAGTIQSLN